MSHSHATSNSVSAASASQRRANRANAKKSTGPRTDAGKRRAALNAVTHGLFCKGLVLAGEDEAEFRAFRNALLNAPALRPQDELELSIAEQYVQARWKLRRLPAAEGRLHQRLARPIIEESLNDALELYWPEGDTDESPDHPDDEEEARVIAVVRRHARGPEGLAHVRKLEEQLARQRRARRREAGNAAAQAPRPIDPMKPHGLRKRIPWAMVPPPPEATPDADETLAISFMQPEGGPIERLARHQQRLELSASRALRELRQLRKDMGVDVTNLPECPFLDEREEEAPARGPVTSVTTETAPATDAHQEAPPKTQNAQNEPNSAEAVTGVGAAGGCEARSCNIEVIEPMKLAPRGAGATHDDDGGVDGRA